MSNFNNDQDVNMIDTFEFDQRIVDDFNDMLRQNSLFFLSQLNDNDGNGAAHAESETPPVDMGPAYDYTPNATVNPMDLHLNTPYDAVQLWFGPYEPQNNFGLTIDPSLVSVENSVEDPVGAMMNNVADDAAPAPADADETLEDLFGEGESEQDNQPTEAVEGQEPVASQTMAPEQEMGPVMQADEPFEYTESSMLTNFQLDSITSSLYPLTMQAPTFFDNAYTAPPQEQLNTGLFTFEAPPMSAPDTGVPQLMPDTMYMPSTSASDQLESAQGQLNAGLPTFPMSAPDTNTPQLLGSAQNPQFMPYTGSLPSTSTSTSTNTSDLPPSTPSLASSRGQKRKSFSLSDDGYDDNDAEFRPSAKRSRQVGKYSCDQCRRSKKKCNGSDGVNCDNCIKGNKTCLISHRDNRSNDTTWEVFLGRWNVTTKVFEEYLAVINAIREQSIDDESRTSLNIFLANGMSISQAIQFTAIRPHLKFGKILREKRGYARSADRGEKLSEKRRMCAEMQRNSKVELLYLHGFLLHLSKDPGAHMADPLPENIYMGAGSNPAVLRCSTTIPELNIEETPKGLRQVFDLLDSESPVNVNML